MTPRGAAGGGRGARACSGCLVGLFGGWMGWGAVRGGKDHDNGLEAGHGEGDDRSESEHINF